jgi:hypothetical protein
MTTVFGDARFWGVEARFLEIVGRSFGGKAQISYGPDNSAGISKSSVLTSAFRNSATQLGKMYASIPSQRAQMN